MTPERFDEVVERQRARFPVEGEGAERMDDVPNAKLRWIVFRMPAGRIRLELQTRPKVRDRRAVGGKRVGAGTRIETTYDLTEYTHTLHAFRETDTGWDEIDAAALG